MKSFITVVLLCGVLFGQEQGVRTILLKSGDKVSGTVVSENDSTILLKTSFGEITINKSNIKPQSITLYLKDGNVVTGDILTSSDANFVLNTTFGIVTIDKNNVDRTSDSGTLIPGAKEKEEFFYGTERLIDVFFDPTGYTMEKGSIYFSGLSWGVALTDEIDISSSYWRYFLGDLNFRPKFRVYKGGNVESEQSLAFGFHIHTAGATGKRRVTTVQDPIYSFNGIVGYQSREEWEDIGRSSDTKLWTELFWGYTVSTLKDDKMGRLSYHAGASLILHSVATMPRAWLAVENDVTSKFKIIGQVYYDPFQQSFQEIIRNRVSKNPFDLDFGFVYATSENLRFGIHFQPYVILFYFKF